MRQKSQSEDPRGRSAFPSLEEQLRAAKVESGSALDKLIRNNQKFEMLRPEEASDQLGLPPWLRVYWRKKHPDGKYFGPSGGYPLVLEHLYEWMLAHPDLPDFDVSDSPAKPPADVTPRGRHAK